jgi:signal transduction histidine kinase
MTRNPQPATRNPDLGEVLRALHEKDRLTYWGKFLQGFVHNVNGPLQNLTMLVDMLISGLELQDRMFTAAAGENEKWTEIFSKQKKRLTQMREQTATLARDLREFMQLYEVEQSAAEVDINVLLTRLAKVFRSDLFFKHHVKSELRLAKNLPIVKVPGKNIVPALFHLFHNAVTALVESPKKELIVETHMEDGEIVVTITDSGPGPPEDLRPDELFDLFVSGWPKRGAKDADLNRHQGFGLYAARQLLLPYGFSICLERHGEATSAIVRIPVKANTR